MKKNRVGGIGVLAAGLALGTMGVLNSGRQTPDDGQGEPSGGGADPGDGLLDIDESMLEVAVATGGDFYFWSPGEFVRSDLRIPSVGEAVLLSYGDLGQEVRGFSFSVDGLTGRLDVFAGAQRMEKVRILRPFGQALHETDPDVDLQVFDRMCIASIDRPASGEWRVKLEGRGKYCLSVHSAVGNGHAFGDPTLAPIQLLDFELVELRGRPGHQGYFPLKGQVAAAERHRIELQLCGSFASVEVLLVGLDGRILGEVLVDTLDRTDDGQWVTALGECVVPDAPFRALVQGNDATGARYQRMLGNSVLPSTEK